MFKLLDAVVPKQAYFVFSIFKKRKGKVLNLSHYIYIFFLELNMHLQLLRRKSTMPTLM
jgi:hypothetical protein